MLATRMMMSGGNLLYEYGVAGTYTLVLPSNAVRVRVTMVGAGGGGAGNVATNSYGGGGGSGLGLRSTRVVSGGDSLSIVVGAGGNINGANGDPGGLSSVTHVASSDVASANGGGGGGGALGGATATGGTGGSSYTLGGSWVLVASQTGNNGSSSTGSVVCSGANLTTLFAISGTGGAGGIFATSTLSAGGTGYGAGAGGGYQAQAGGSRLGAPGFVRVEINY